MKFLTSFKYKSHRLFFKKITINFTRFAAARFIICVCEVKVMILKLKSKKFHVQGVMSFIFEPEKPVEWEPGQYLHYVLPHPDADDRGAGRWFTISSAPFEKDIVLTTRFTDDGSGSSFKKALHGLENGQEIEFDDGPKGFFLVQPDVTRHIFIAGGIGITPYRSMLLQLDHDNKHIPVDLLYSNRDANFIFDEELAAVAKKHPEFKIKKYSGQQIQKDELEIYSQGGSFMFYLSGPRPMVESYQHMLEELAVPEKRILTDYFPGYND